MFPVMSKRERRIDDFFHCKDPEKQQQKQKQCRYFYMDWSVGPPYIAQWMCERPVPLDFQADIEWKQGGSSGGTVITICGLFVSTTPDDTDTDTDTDTAPTTDNDNNDTSLYQDATLISLLKSNLQKCVRRQLTKRAKETARYLMALDLQLLVRRLAIIMLEDVVLHQSFSTLVWLTAALSKQFCVQIGQTGGQCNATITIIKEWLMGLVDMLCGENNEHYWTYNIDNKEVPTTVATGMIRKLWSDATSLLSIHDNNGARDIVYSLLFRQSYGGLKGDCSMMLSFASLVLRSHQQHQQQQQQQQQQPQSFTISTATITSISLSAVKRLDLVFVEHCSVDFHCQPGMLLSLARFCEQNNKQNPLRDNAPYTQQDIRAAVWHHSSKQNGRVLPQALPQSERDKKRDSHTCYFTIKRKLEWMQQEYAKQCCNKVVMEQYRLDTAGHKR